MTAEQKYFRVEFLTIYCYSVKDVTHNRQQRHLSRLNATSRWHKSETEPVRGFRFDQQQTKWHEIIIWGCALMTHPLWVIHFGATVPPPLHLQTLLHFLYVYPTFGCSVICNLFILAWSVSGLTMITLSVCSRACPGSLFCSERQSVNFPSIIHNVRIRVISDYVCDAGVLAEEQAVLKLYWR